MSLTPQHRSLPMADLVHGNRSPVTCHLRCGDACFGEAPNTTSTSYFRDIGALALSRRSVLGAAAGTAAVGLVASPAAAERVHGHGGGHRHPLPEALAFTAIAPVPKTVDAFTVPTGFRVGPDHPLGRPDPASARRPSTPTLRAPPRRPVSSATTATTSTSS